MATPQSAAIYARISSDQDGTAKGIQRQLKDCRALARSLGWGVAEEYVDNDISAYSGKLRPAYRHMLADIADGLRDGVMMYHVDRLTRIPAELEEFLAVVDAARVKNVKFAATDLDVGTSDGLLVIRLLAVVAAHESGTKSRRILRKMEANAEAGLPHGAGNRPFGYEDDKVTIRESEAAVLREVVARYLAGESQRSLRSWLDAQGIRTPYGMTWRTGTLRRLMASGRIAGLREHRGEVVATAVWPAIITVDDRNRILAKIARGASTNRRAVQTYLLTGLLTCGRCGGRLFSSRRTNPNGTSVRRYVCLSGPDHGGCGRLTVVADPLERLVADAVLYRLNTRELADALAGKAAQDKHTAQAANELGKANERLDDLAQMFGAGEINRREWLTARKPIEARITDLERRLARASDTGILRELAGTGDALGDSWATLNLGRQNAIVSAILDHAVIAPGARGATSLDPARVELVWRL